MERDSGETLTQSMNRINIYRALTSPTYLLLTSDDPILQAFEMSRKTNKLSLEHPEHQVINSAFDRRFAFQSFISLIRLLYS